MFFLQSPCILFILNYVRRTIVMMEMSSAAAVSDRISELPEGIIHVILARLESHESAARTSILSKRWLRLWSTFPIVEFKRTDVLHGKYRTDVLQRKFQSFAAATSKRLRAAVPPLPLDSFTIELREVCDQTRQSLHQLLSSVAGGRSSPIKVVVKTKPFKSNSIEGEMLLNFRRTKFLKLKGFDLSGLHNFELNNLQKLSLKDVQVSKQSFLSCLANAPRLEKLKLQYILGIDSLDISASNFPSLVSLDFETYHAGPYLQQLQLSSDTLLRTLTFVGQCELLKLVSAPSVETVYLYPKGELGCSELEKLISKFPSLKSLYFNGNTKLRVSSDKLLELTFAQSNSKMEFEIDTPNLETLTIETDGLKINSTVVNVSPSCQCVFDCTMAGSMTTSWFIELRNCLAALATRFRQLVFKLDISISAEVEELDLSQVGHECSPLAVQHLLMGIDIRGFRSRSLFKKAHKPRSPFKKAHIRRLFDGLLWTVHPKALSVATTRYNYSLSSYISDQIEMKNLENCCSNGKCWRHQFKDVKITSVIVDDVVSTIDESMISQPSIDMIFLITRGPFD